MSEQTKTLSEIKKEILEWRDYYGGDILDDGAVKKAKSKKQLKSILDNHYRFLEHQNIDALNHCDQFISSLGLRYL